MIIHLREDVERSLEAAGRSGQFASADEAMTEAARLRKPSTVNTANRGSVFL